MVEQDTLLAHLVPLLTQQVEPAATRALAYILTKSETAMEAFNSLVRSTTDETLVPVRRVYAEEGYTTEDGSGGRLDLAGYDLANEQRVIVEAKFGANLLRGQGSDYLTRLSQNGKSVLMFLVPEYRIDYLWDEVKRDISRGTGEIHFLDEKTLGKIRVTKISKSESYLMMVSWRDLLQTIRQQTGDDASTSSDVQQLSGLTEKMDVEAFRPLVNGEYTGEFARRSRDLRRIYEGVVTRLRDQTWVDMQGYSTSGQPLTGYGRYFRLSGGECWFGVFFNLWAMDGLEETPFWLQLYQCNQDVLYDVSRTLGLSLVEDPFRRGRWCYSPIQLKENAALEDVIAGVMGQIKRIADEVAARE